MSDTEYRLCDCGKRCLSRREAHQAINDAKKRQHIMHMKRIPRRAYRCDICGTWHTTSQPNRTKQCRE
jgi:hypothetical protein